MTVILPVSQDFARGFGSESVAIPANIDPPRNCFVLVNWQSTRAALQSLAASFGMALGCSQVPILDDLAITTANSAASLNHLLIP